MTVKLRESISSNDIPRAGSIGGSMTLWRITVFLTDKALEELIHEEKP
jgi:hypothetical protein